MSINRQAAGSKKAGQSVGGQFAPIEKSEASGAGLGVDEFGGGRNLLEPEPHESAVINELAASGVHMDIATLREAAARNSLLEADLNGIQVWADHPQRVQRYLDGAVMRAEAPARLAAAGIAYPETWDEMSGSAKDLWEERQLRMVQRRSQSEI